MQSVAKRFRPKSGFSYVLHIGLNTLLPLLVFVLVRAGFSNIGLALIILSKWRMFSVRPRYWFINIRANGVDIMVGISFLIFMTHSSSALWQLLWVLCYILWLTLLKPGSGIIAVSLQALIAQSLGLMSVFLSLNSAPLYQLIIGVWVVCYLAARHYFTIYEEPFTSLFSHTWGYFAAGLTWILGHWLLFYGVFSQPMVILSAISFGLACLYYLSQNDRLNSLLKKQIILIMVAAIVVVLVFSDWTSRIGG